MENGKTDAQTSTCRIMGNHQLIIITRLLQCVETLQNIDELFTWLADIMMQRMDIQVVQFWAMQGYTNGRERCELRTSTHHNISLPSHIVVNQPVADTVEHLLNKRQSFVPQPVKNIFSEYLGKQLMRYNLNHWACQCISNSILLPPARNTFSYEKIATPLTLAVSIFSQHTPSSRLLPTLSHILEHVLPIAKQHGLLMTPILVEQALQVSNHEHSGKRLTLAEFIPYHTQPTHTSKEGLIGEQSLIQDKNAYHLYLEIDGHKNIS